MLSDNPDNRHVSKFGNFYEHETSFSKTEVNYCPHGTCATVADSIVNDIDGKRLSMNNRSANVFTFLGLELQKQSSRGVH